MLGLFFLLSSFAVPIQDATVRAGGAEVATHCAGTRAPGSPLVVLESGGGNGFDVWRRVQPAIAAFARVCGYDRPTLIRDGIGPRASIVPVDVVKTLHEVLTGLGEPPPYVMVGHSYGGMIVRLYATTYPRDVVGMVLVESSHEDQIARFEAIDPSTVKEMLAPSRSEALDLPAFCDALHASPWQPTMRYVVLTRGRMSDASDPTGRLKALEGVWQELQRELARRSPTGRQIIATGSGHYIQGDQPELVIEAVRSVLPAQ
jgi:pimeloyl-ACP methyl ester carboxylesterase